MSLFNDLFGTRNTQASNYQAQSPEQILVSGQREQPSAQPPGIYDDFLLGNREPIQEREYQAEQSQDAAQHKGMFGIKGTLRDVLGAISDGFLVQSGNAPIYRPHRQREMEGDAQAGFTRDPLAAAERMSGVNPELAAQMLEQARAQELRREQLDSLRGNRQSQIQNRQQDMTFELSEKAAQLLRRAQTPEERMYAFKVIDTFARQNGLSLDDLGLSMAMTPEEAGVYSGLGITVNQQEQLPFRERALDQADRRLDQGDESNQIRRQAASRPPAPRNPTDRDVYIDLKNKPAGQLSPGERGFIKRYEEGTGGENRGSRRSVPSSSNNRPRIRSVRDVN